MAQIKKFQGGGPSPESLKKYKIKLDGQDIEFTEEELDAIKANAFKQIEGTKSIGTGDEHMWNDRYTVWKDMVKNGTFNFDTDPNQTISASYSGSTDVSNEDRGLGKRGKVRKATLFGKTFGGIDSEDRQTSMINYYMGVGLRNFQQDRINKEKLDYEGLILKQKSEAAEWAKAFKQKLSIGYSTFGDQYTPTNTKLLLTPYWDMPDDESRLDFVFNGILQNLAPIFSLDPTRDKLKIDLLKGAGFDVAKVQENFKDYQTADSAKQKIKALKELWQYSNLAQSIAEDTPFWSKEAFTNLGKPTGGPGDTPPAKPTSLTPDDIAELQEAIDGQKTNFPYEIYNPFGEIIPNEYYQLRSFDFKVNGQSTLYEDFVKQLQALNPSEDKDLLTKNLLAYNEAVNNAYGVHTSNWLEYMPTETNIPPNSLLRRIMPNVGNQPYNIRILGQSDNYVLLQTMNPQNGEKDIFGNLIPSTTIVDLSKNLAYTTKSFRYNPVTKKYEIRVGSKILQLDKIEPHDSKKAEQLLASLGAIGDTSTNNKQQYDRNDRIPPTTKRQYVEKKEGGVIVKAQQGLKLQFDRNDAKQMETVTNYLQQKYGLTPQEAQDLIQTSLGEGKIETPKSSVTEWIADETPIVQNVGGTSNVGGGPVNLANLFDDGSISSADMYDLTTLGLDLASFLPGVGGFAGIASAGTGLMSNIKRDGFQLEDLGIAALDLGFAAASFVPVVGGLAKTGKIISNVNKLRKPLKVIHTALLAQGAINLLKSLEKIIRGDIDQLNVEDISNLVGITSTLKFSRKANQNMSLFTTQKLTDGKGMLSVKINTPDGKAIDHKVILNKTQIDLLRSADNQELLAKELILSRLPKDAELQSRVGDFSKITADDIEVPMTNNYNWRKPHKNMRSIGTKADQVLIKDRATMTHPLQDSRSTFLGRTLNVLYGDPVKGTVNAINDPNIRSVATPITDKYNRPRVELKDNQLVDAENFEEIKAKNFTELKAKLANNKQGVEILKRYNEAADIDTQLTEQTKKSLSTEKGQVAAREKLKDLLKKLEKIDTLMEKASVIAKDARMQLDVNKARADVRRIILKHRGNLTPQLTGKEPSAPTIHGKTERRPDMPTPKLPDLMTILKGNSLLDRFPNLPKIEVGPTLPKNYKVKKQYPKSDKPKKVYKPNNNKKIKSKEAENLLLPKPKEIKLFNRQELMKLNSKKKTSLNKPTPKAKPPRKIQNKKLGGTLIPMFQNEGIIPGMKSTLFSFTPSPFAPKFSKGKENPFSFTPSELFSTPFTRQLITTPNTLEYENPNAKYGIKSLYNPNLTTNTTSEEDLGAQSGITKAPWKNFGIDPVWALKTLSTLNKIKSLRAQDTRYNPALQVALPLPQSTVSGTMLLEGKYNDEADLARTALSQNLTADLKLNTANRANTEANIRTFLLEGNTKVLLLQDALRQRQVSEKAASIGNQQQVTNSNLAELAKSLNLVRTNENFVKKNVADLQSNLVDDYANNLNVKENEKSQLQQQLGLISIQRAFDSKYAPQFEEYQRLANMKLAGSLTDPLDIEKYNTLNKLIKDVNHKVYKLSYQYMIDKSLPDLENI